MKLIISCPDGMGDLILRQPLFAELRDQGHEVCLLVREHVLPVVPFVLPGAATVPIKLNPYVEHGLLDVRSEEFEEVWQGIRTWGGTDLVIAASQRTPFDEELMRRWDAGSIWGIDGGRAPASVPLAQSCGNPAPSRWSKVEWEVPDIERNHLLGKMMLGESYSPKNPTIEVGRDLQDKARHCVGADWLDEGPFWVTCVGHHEGNRRVNWTPEGWKELLTYVTDTKDLRLLLVGSEAEEDFNRGLLRELGGESTRLKLWSGEPDSIEALVGIASLAEGYIGRDTGPMHLAAAVGKPVFAVFAGGTWPRFIPQAREGLVVALDVPCQGCMFYCHLSELYCITEIPASEVCGLFDRFLEERPSPVERVLLERSSGLAEKMEREGAIKARENDWRMRNVKREIAQGGLKERERRAREKKERKDEVKLMQSLAESAEEIVSEVDKFKALPWVSGRKWKTAVRLFHKGEAKSQERIAARLRKLKQRWDSNLKKAPPVGHLGFGFYGAGNFGDDLMLQGFLEMVMRQNLRLRLTGAVPEMALPSQRLRFPEVSWAKGSKKNREKSIAECDYWLGLGGTPFQSDSGSWMLGHLKQEAEFCRKYNKPMLFLGIGVGDLAAVEDSCTKEVVNQASSIWARDSHSAALLRGLSPKAVIHEGADFAHIALRKARPVVREVSQTGLVFHFENERKFSMEVLTQLLEEQVIDRWLVQDVRTLPGSEREVLSKLPEPLSARLAVDVPDYEDAVSITELLWAWKIPKLVASSRYHGLMVAAWAGARVVAIERNEKLRGAAETLGCERLSEFCDAEEVKRALRRAREVELSELEKLSELAEESFLELMRHPLFADAVG